MTDQTFTCATCWHWTPADRLTADMAPCALSYGKTASTYSCELHSSKAQPPAPPEQDQSNARGFAMPYWGNLRRP